MLRLWMQTEIAQDVKVCRIKVIRVYKITFVSKTERVYETRRFCVICIKTIRYICW